MEKNQKQIYTSTDEKLSELTIEDNILKMAEFRKERDENYRTLLRMVIEFSVELMDSHFLFYDLFLFFKDEKLEDMFISQLEPFIMAGKFIDWEIANENL